MLDMVFMGTPEFALPSLEALLGSEHRVRAVVTAPDEQRGRGQKVSFTPVKQAAIAAGLTVLQPESLRGEDFLRTLRSLAPDLIVVVAFRILPPEVFTVPRLGSFNLHASLLPKYRGAAPINRALMNGETETGVTTFLLREKVDTGDVLLQEKAAVHEDMTAGELHDLLARLGARVVLETADGIAAGALTPRQQDNALASSAPKIHRDDCRIDWTLPEKRVHDHVRGLSPHPGAWTMHGDRLLKVVRTARLQSHESADPPGSVIEARARLIMACAGGAIEIVRLKPEGRKEMTAAEFLRGYPLRQDEMLG